MMRRLLGRRPFVCLTVVIGILVGTGVAQAKTTSTAAYTYISSNGNCPWNLTMLSDENGHPALWSIGTDDYWGGSPCSDTSHVAPRTWIALKQNLMKWQGYA